MSKAETAEKAVENINVVAETGKITPATANEQINMLR